jgi:hypothetical protein
VLADSHSVIELVKNHISYKCHGVSDERHTEIHTAETLVPKSTAFEFEKSLEISKDINHEVIITKLRNSMEQGPYCEANRFSQSRNSLHFMELEGSLP